VTGNTATGTGHIGSARVVEQHDFGMSKVSTSCHPTVSQPPQHMASPIPAVGENDKDGREASRRDAKRLGEVGGKRRG
jgi:hypothetical protein